MSKTPILQIPLLEAAQSQKHVTHNEALMALDVLTMPAVKDRHLAMPPGSPVEGDRYIVAASATGAWAAKDLQIAAFQDGVWIFYPANSGWEVWVEDETAFYVFDGSAWMPGPSGGGVTLTQLEDGTVTKVGVNAAADDTNKLSVNSDAVLFNHNGSDAQVKVNKNLSSDTGSHLFQTNFSGRAEFGLTGSDDFQIKVSSDGTNWTDAMSIDRGTGIVTFHQGTVGDNGGGNSLDSLARRNMALAWLQILNIGNLPATILIDGFADSFVDESGVDIGGSTNLIYDLGGELYNNFGHDDGNHVDSIETVADYTWVDRTWSLDNDRTISHIGVKAVTSGPVTLKIVHQDSTTQFDVVVSETFTHGGSGWEDFQLSSSYPVPSSGTYRLAVRSQTVSLRYANNILRSWKAGDVIGNDQSGFVADSANMPLLRATYLPIDMTLLSNSIVANAQPSKVEVVLQHEPIDSINMNTDCIVEVSRDGGVTWTMVLLEKSAELANVDILVGSQSFASLPPGTLMKYRVNTLNSKSQRIHGIALYWE